MRGVEERTLYRGGAVHTSRESPHITHTGEATHRGGERGGEEVCRGGVEWCKEKCLFPSRLKLFFRINLIVIKS